MLIYIFLVMSIEKEIADRMLDVLTTGTIIEEVQIDVPINEQIKSIKRQINNTDINVRRDVVNIIIVNNYKHLLNDSQLGITINLDKLPYHVIELIYKFIN